MAAPEAISNGHLQDDPDTMAPVAPQGASEAAQPITPPVIQENVEEQEQRIPQHVHPDVLRKVDEVLYSDIGVTTLLNRLKQSIASARDFAIFLKKRSSLEEEHATGLKKLARSTVEMVHRPETRQGTYASQLLQVAAVHERMSDNGMKAALSFNQMHEDTNTLAGNIERGRKQWKATGLAAEKKVQDAESQYEKAKHKYDNLAEDYDRVRTGDRGSGRVFGLKGPKSAAQHEEDLHKKVQAAEADYASKTQTAQALRQELLSSLRPQAVEALKLLIKEIDDGLTAQVQKYVTFSEKLLVADGMLLTPVSKEANVEVPPSVSSMVAKIDNLQDFHDHIFSQASKVPPKPAEIKFEKHGSLVSNTQPPLPQNTRRSSMQLQQPPPQPSQSFAVQPVQQPQQHPQGPPGGYQPFSPSHAQNQPGGGLQGPPHQTPYSQGPPAAYQSPSYPSASQSHLPQHQPGGVTYSSAPSNYGYNPNAPPIHPVFGINLEELYRRDATPVPLPVVQLIQAVEQFGLDMEGIYRNSGQIHNVQSLRSRFESDPNGIDFRNPEAFYQDVNNCAHLLKKFFSELPDPLFTNERYQQFIEAARIDDPIVRRDSLHALVNELPDAHYATLRALVLHLARVQEHERQNRMSSSNLAICFAPTLMGHQQGGQIADSGLQSRVIDTILSNTYQIFDEE